MKRASITAMKEDIDFHRGNAEYELHRFAGKVRYCAPDAPEKAISAAARILARYDDRTGPRLDYSRKAIRRLQRAIRRARSARASS